MNITLKSLRPFGLALLCYLMAYQVVGRYDVIHNFVGNMGAIILNSLFLFLSIALFMYGIWRLGFVTKWIAIAFVVIAAFFFLYPYMTGMFSEQLYWEMPTEFLGK